MGPMHFNMSENEKIPRPKSLRDIPRFLRELISGFFYRLFYIFGIVWQTGHFILIGMVLSAVLSGLLPVLGVYLSSAILSELQKVIELNAVNQTLGAGSVAVFWGSAVMLMIVLFFAHKIISTVVTQFNAALTRIAGEKVIKQVRINIMTKAKDIDMASFDIPDFYEKLENANREAAMRPVSVLSSTLTTVSTVISLVGYIVILMQGLPLATLAIIAVSIPSAIINFSYRKKNFNYLRHRSKNRRQMTYYSDLMVNKDMVKEIRMYNLSDTFINSYHSVFKSYFKGMKHLIVSESVWMILLAIGSSLVSGVFFSLIAADVVSGGIDIGKYSLYTGALTSIAASISSLINNSSYVYEGTLFIKNLISFMNEEKNLVPKVEPAEAVSYGKPHTIDFVNVSFKYPGSDRFVLKNINLHFRPGETVVLVGLNGSGKTTLIKLLTRLYDPTEGYILLDGKDIRDYDVNQLYKLFGIIFQDFGKYAFTVKENIHFGNIDREMNDEEIREAARQSNAEDYINRLPDGYDTPLMRFFEANGTELSIGQWQKLAIARAFYSDSDILILDEPTASLDAIAEQEIFNQFDELRREKTTIFVSHRLSSATVASKIVVLENGKIIEEGVHGELMQKKGRYYELFSTQANRYIADADQNETANA